MIQLTSATCVCIGERTFFSTPSWGTERIYRNRALFANEESMQGVRGVGMRSVLMILCLIFVIIKNKSMLDRIHKQQHHQMPTEECCWYQILSASHWHRKQIRNLWAISWCLHGKNVLALLPRKSLETTYRYVIIWKWNIASRKPVSKLYISLESLPLLNVNRYCL